MGVGVSPGSTQEKGASKQKDSNFFCPETFGFYPHEHRCDLYYSCEDGIPALKTCGNGLAFDTSNPSKEDCNYLFAVDCDGRTDIEAPISTPNCPRLYGIFPDDSRCDVFWNCWNGESNRYQCAPGLAYDREQRVCMWADQVPECKVEEIASGFQCPPAGQVASSGSFSRHPHPEDCRKYYICLDGTPREYGCPIGTVFKIGDDDVSGFCTEPTEVQGCEDYYGDLDLKNIGKFNGKSSNVPSRPTNRIVNLKPQKEAKKKAADDEYPEYESSEN